MLQAHEVLALEVLTLLLETPTDDSVEVASAFLKECGMKLTEVTPRGVNSIFDRLRDILHDSPLPSFSLSLPPSYKARSIEGSANQDQEVDKRVQYMIEVLFTVRKDKFSVRSAPPSSSGTR